MVRQLWNDESGAIVSAEVVLVGTTLVIGSVVGLKSLRDAVVSELADVGQAISNLNQSYNFGGVSGHSANSDGSTFSDTADFCDTAATANSDPGTKSRCVTFAVPAAPES